MTKMTAVPKLPIYGKNLENLLRSLMANDLETLYAALVALVLSCLLK